MESQRQRRNKNSKKSKVKSCISQSSYWISFGLHCLLFLILAMICDKSQITKSISLNLNFTAPEIQEISFDPINIELPSIKEDVVESKEDQLEASIAQNINNDDAISIEFESTEPLSTDYTSSLPDIKYLNQKVLNEESTENIDDSNLLATGNGIPRIGNGSSGDGNNTEMERRLKRAGAKTGDIQVSISWNNYNDIDVWLEHQDATSKITNVINWMNRSVGMGFLDVDMNYRPQTNQAVENIYWAEGEAPFGVYNIYLQNYHLWENNIDKTMVDVRIIIDDQVFNKRCSVRLSDGLVKIFTFVRKPNKELLAKKKNRQQLKDNYGPGTFTPFGYSPDNIVIPPVPTFQ